MITERQFLDQIEAARAYGANPSYVVCVDGDGDGVIGLEELERLAASDPNRTVATDSN